MMKSEIEKAISYVEENLTSDLSLRNLDAFWKSILI